MGKLPGDLCDEDGAIVALRRDSTTRGQAAALFAGEHDIGFTKVRVRLRAFRDDDDLRREYEADGIPEPYDGWPLRECARGASGSAEYWCLEKAA